MSLKWWGHFDIAFLTQEPHLDQRFITTFESIKKQGQVSTAMQDALVDQGRQGQQRTCRCTRNSPTAATSRWSENFITSKWAWIVAKCIQSNHKTGSETLYPYQMIRRHELFPVDHARRLAFCNWFLERPPRFLESLVIGDEACFCMNSSLSTHNILQYAPRGEKPVEFSYEKKDCRQKLTVWIGMIGDGTLSGPFFFQQNINGERYLQMINDQIVPVLDEGERFRRQQNGRFRHLWWAQDGAPLHRSRDVMARLQELFGDRIVALNQPVEWPPRSPDLTPWTSSCGGTFKAKVVQSPPANLIELQERITREANDLREDRQLLCRVFRGMLHRAEKCLERRGGHVED